MAAGFAALVGSRPTAYPPRWPSSSALTGASIRGSSNDRSNVDPPSMHADTGVGPSNHSAKCNAVRPDNSNHRPSRNQDWGPAAHKPQPAAVVEPHNSRGNNLPYQTRRKSEFRQRPSFQPGAKVQAASFS